ncbi:O-antigen ligase family protein [Photobacterium sp. R1]
MTDARLRSSRNQCLLGLALCVVFGAIWRLIPHPLLLPVFGLIPFAILFVLTRPFLMVLLFVVFSFFRIHEVFPQLYSLKIPLLLSLASLGALCWHIGISQRYRAYWHRDLTVLTTFAILVLIGVIMAENRGIALAYFKATYWKILIMVFAIAWLSRAAKDFALSSNVIAFSGMVVGLVALYNKANGIGLVEGTRVTIGRAIGSMLGDPNDLALVLMFPTSFAVALLLTKSMPLYSRLIGLLSTPILFSAVLATQSRGGLLGILTVFGLFGYRRMKSKTLFFSLGALAAALLFLAAGISDRASGGAVEEGIDASAMGRLYAWEAATKMAVAHPFTGVGLDNFYANYFFYSPHWDGLNHAVHSTWFGVLAETGFLGLTVFVTMIICLIRTAFVTLGRIETNLAHYDPAVYTTAQAVLAGLLGTVVSGTFLTQGFTWPIYILAALVIAVGNYVKTQASQSSPEPRRQPQPHPQQETASGDSSVAFCEAKCPHAENISDSSQKTLPD